MWQDDERLVKDSAGQLVPTMSGGIPGNNWYSVYDDEKGAQLIAKASDGDYVAYSVLCVVAARFIKSGCSMPPHLREYVAEGLMDAAGSLIDGHGRRRGRDPYANHHRDRV